MTNRRPGVLMWLQGRGDTRPEVLDTDVGRKAGQRDRANESLRFMSPEQYRKKFGRDPVFPEPQTEPWPDAGGWQGWTMPWPSPTVIVVMAEHTGTFLWNRSADPGRAPFADDYVLEPEVLGVTARLAERLVAWNDRYGRGLINAAWWAEGWSLAQELQHEFDRRGLDVEVLFHDVDGQERAIRDGRRSRG
jgi:hypothetical protein